MSRSKPKCIKVWAPIDDFFEISARGGTVTQEFLGGITHFMGSVFNIVATASVLSAAGYDFEDGCVAVAWSSAMGCILVGLLSNLPISVASGAGPNMTVAYTLVKPLSKGGMGSYADAMLVCVSSGMLVTILAACGVVDRIVDKVPSSLKYAICVGIGLLCALVGFHQAGMVVRSDEGLIGPGDFHGNPEIWLSLLGLLVLTLLNDRKAKGSILVAMLALAILDWSFVRGWPTIQLPKRMLPKTQDFDLSILAMPGFWSQVIGMSSMLIFDGMGCLLGIARLAGRMNSKGEVDGGTGTFLGIGLGTSLAGVFGASPLVLCGASSGAVTDGAKTGLSAVIGGALFLLLGLPFTSVFAAMPPCATSFVLIYTGASFAAEAVHIDWEDPISAIPAFLCIASQPFMFSIADGIYMGLASSLALRLLSGRFSSDRHNTDTEVHISDKGLTAYGPLSPTRVHTRRSKQVAMAVV